MSKSCWMGSEQCLIWVSTVCSCLFSQYSGSVRLLYFSSVITDYNKGDTSKKEFSRQVWYETKERLLKILQDFGQKVVPDPEVLKKYNMSRKHTQCVTCENSSHDICGLRRSKIARKHLYSLIRAFAISLATV